MSQIHIKRFSFACGFTGVLLYVGCILLMAMVGRDGTIFFFNSLLHGIDTSSVIRMNTSVFRSTNGHCSNLYPLLAHRGQCCSLL